jgi:hypothetical protein
MSSLADHLRAATDDPIALQLVEVLCGHTGISSAGYPFLEEGAYTRLRDHIPHVLGMGHAVWAAMEQFSRSVDGVDEEIRHHFVQSRRVVQQVLRTASITAPPALWLMRYVAGSLREAGVVDRLLAGEQIVVADSDLDHVELDIDLSFLSVRGVLARRDGCFSLAPRSEARRILEGIPVVGGNEPVDAAEHWADAFAGRTLNAQVRDGLKAMGDGLTPRTSTHQERWFPCLEEVILGHRLVPLVIGLAAAGRTSTALRGSLRPADLIPGDTELGRAAVDILVACGVLQAIPVVDEWVSTPLGRRVLERGPGPFGIIEAYHPYMQHAGTILRGGRGSVHLSRSANIAASQRANRESFRRANDALDAFCADTGFVYSVFIEHALGRGEATRQRFVRSGDDGIQYVGADLEDPAIDAAMAERDNGVLPEDMVFVRQADIARASILLDALKAEGIDSHGAVMMVGNGFHEIRHATDEKVVDALREYREAGLVLVFTEETALSIRDQQATGWNTYHPAFRYVHEKSGQGLRPAEMRVSDPDDPMPMSWTECCRRAGYVRMDRYCRPGRTIYPCPPPDGRNPSTYMNYFFVPADRVEALGLSV